MASERVLPHSPTYFVIHSAFIIYYIFAGPIELLARDNELLLVPKVSLRDQRTITLLYSGRAGWPYD